MLSAENVAAIESEGRRLGRAARREPERPVPHYPGWDLRDLISHTASIHARTTSIYRELPKERIQAPRAPEGAGILDWYDEKLEEMLAVMTDSDPSIPCWAFGGGTNLGFWEERMVIETGVHRWDAYETLGEADRLLDIVAGLGLDEFGHWYVPMIEADGGVELRAIDMGRTWLYGDEPRTVIEGTASDIYLRLMQRTSPVELPTDWATAVDSFGKPPKR